MNQRPEQRDNSTRAAGPAPVVLHRGAKFALEQLTVLGADGVERKREVVRHPGAVVIVPILREPAVSSSTNVVLIRNHRISLGRSIWEMPAGTLEIGEDPAVCARRELEEETGYTAATIIPLGRFHTTPGLTDELMWAYAAEGLTNVGQRPEPDERITVHVLSAREALEMITSGELMDGKSIVSLLLAERRGLLGVAGR